MRSEALARDLNEGLRLPNKAWDAFSSLGDAENGQAYLHDGSYGVIGRPGHWTVVFAAAGRPAIPAALPHLGLAMQRAQDAPGIRGVGE